MTNADWQQAKSKLHQLFPNVTKRGQILAELLKMPVDRRLEYFDEEDGAVVAALSTLAGTSHLWFTDGKSSVAAPFRQGQVQLAALEELYPWWPPKAYIVNGYWVGESATPGWGDLDLEAVGALGRTQQQPIPVKRASGPLQALTWLIPAHRASPHHDKSE